MRTKTTKKQIAKMKKMDFMIKYKGKKGYYVLSYYGVFKHILYLHKELDELKKKVKRLKKS